MLRNPVSMKNLIWITLGALLVLTVLSNAVNPKAALADKRSGEIRITKNCSHFVGNAGDYCTITSSNVEEIPKGSQVFYTQAAMNPSTPEGGSIGFDSNAVVYVGYLDWALGRCTLDPSGNYGLCTFYDGIGALAGFHAHVNVTPFENTPTNVDYYWNGTYNFASDPE